MELGLFPMMLLIIVLIHCGQTQDYTPSAAVEDDSQDALPETTLTMWPENPVFTGESVTLKCEVKGFNGWTYEWYKRNKVKDSWTQVNQSESYRLNISEDAVVNNDQYRCRGMRYHNPSTTQYSKPASIITKALPRVSITVNPQGTVFAGESVTLKCSVKDDNDGWTHQWYKWNELKQWIALLQSVNYTINKDTLTISKHTVLNGEQYGCRVERHDRPKTSQNSSVTLTAKVKPKPELTSSLRASALIGNPVILYCKLKSSAGWSFYWSRHAQNPENETNTTTSSYTISSVSPSDGGQYWCRAGRGNPVYYTNYSDALWLNITGVSSPVSLIISPSRSQHFSGDSLSLRCEDQSGSSGWRVKQFTHTGGVSDCSTGWGSVRGSTCIISSLSTSHTGVYWCQSESGGSSNPANITVHDGDVILDSPVHPVIEGDSLSLKCLVNKTLSDLKAYFYKDGSLFQNQSTGQIIIPTISKSDEGLYHCKYPERRESPQSWVSVKVSSRSRSVTVGVVGGLSFTLLLIITLAVLWRYKKNKGRGSMPPSTGHQQNTGQTTGQQQSWSGPGNSLLGPSLLQAGGEQIYANVANRTTGPIDGIYSQIELKNLKPQSKDGAGSSDVTYAQIEMQLQKKQKQTGKSHGGTDVVYSELKHKPENGDSTKLTDNKKDNTGNTDSLWTY